MLSAWTAQGRSGSASVVAVGGGGAVPVPTVKERTPEIGWESAEMTRQFT